MLHQKYSLISTLFILLLCRSGWAEANCTEARSALERGDISQAKIILDNLINSTDCHGEALALKGRISANQNIEEAISYYERALKCPGILPRDSILEIATAYSLINRHQEAASLLNGYLEKNPDDSEFLHELSLTYLAIGEIDSACKLLAKGLKLAPEDIDIATDYGSCLLYQNKKSEALTHFKKLATAHSEVANVWHFLGETHQATHQLKEAVNAYKEALKINPGRGITNYRLGRLLQQQGDLAVAKPFLKKALNSDYQAKAIEALLENSLAQANLNEANYWLEAASKYQSLPPSKIAIYQAEIARLSGNNQEAQKILLDLVAKDNNQPLAWKILLAIGEEDHNKDLQKRAKSALESLKNH